jgi:hypothetical protein
MTSGFPQGPFDGNSATWGKWGKNWETALTGKDYEYKYKNIGRQLAGYQGSAQASLQHALAAIQHGYGGAQDSINMGGSYATKQLLDREKQGFAQNQQSAISRGLYDSTAFDAGQRGISADTNNALAGLNAQLAQLGSNVKIGQGQAEAGVYGQMSQADQNYEQLLLQLGLNTQYGKQGGAGNAVLSLIGGLFGGGGGGGNVSKAGGGG